MRHYTLRNVIRRLLNEEALGLHGAGMTEEELESRLGYGGIQLNKDGPVTDEEAAAIAQKISKEKPTRIFAYSRGAAALSKAAMSKDSSNLPPVTYVAPAALRKWTDAPVPSVPGGSITIIGDKDSAVPVKQACQIAKQAGTPLYVFPDKSHVSILYTRGEVSGDAFEVDVSRCVADEELPDWGRDGKGNPDDVLKQQKAIARYRKNAAPDDKKVKEAILRNFIKEIIVETSEPSMREIPRDWKIYAHHLTIAFGRDAKEWKANNTDLMETQQEIFINKICYNENVIAAVANTHPDVIVKNRVPHVTIATAPGIPPNESNTMLAPGTARKEIEVNMTLTGVIADENKGYVGIILDPASHEDLVSATLSVLGTTL